MATYTALTKGSGLRIREDHNVSSPVVSSIQLSGTPVVAHEKWEATENGTNYMKGDIWLKITYNGITGWIAYRHMGDLFCTSLSEVQEPEENPIEIVYKEPDFFWLELPDGARVKYVKSEG